MGLPLDGLPTTRCIRSGSPCRWRPMPDVEHFWRKSYPTRWGFYNSVQLRCVGCSGTWKCLRLPQQERLLFFLRFEANQWDLKRVFLGKTELKCWQKLTGFFLVWMLYNHDQLCMIPLPGYQWKVKVKAKIMHPCWPKDVMSSWWSRLHPGRGISPILKCIYIYITHQRYHHHHHHQHHHHHHHHHRHQQHHHQDQPPTTRLVRFTFTLPETKSSPLKIARVPKTKRVFQSFILRGYKVGPYQL